MNFVAEREAKLLHAGSQAVLSEIRRELANIRPAWHWAIQHHQLELVTLSMKGLSRSYKLLGLLQEGKRAFGDAVNRVQELLQTQARPHPNRIGLLGELMAEQALFLNDPGSS